MIPLAPAAPPGRDRELALVDHAEVHQAVARSALAGGTAGLLQGILPGPLGDALGLLAVGLAVVPPRSLGSAAAALLAACAAAGAGLLGATWGARLGLATELQAGLVAAAAAAMYLRELEGGAARRLLAGAVGAASVVAALFVTHGLLVGLLAGLPAALGWLLAGGAGGLVAGLGVVGRELAWVPRAVAVDDLAASRGALPGASAAEDALPRPDRTCVRVAVAPPAALELIGDGEGVEGEVGELLGRAAHACQQAREALGDEAPAAARAAADLVGRIGAFARRWRDLDRQLHGLDRAALSRRAAAMGERAAAAVDDEVASQYRRAERALGDQLADLDAIAGWQERSLARLHHHVAVLERLRLAALHRRSVAAGRSGDELTDLVEELEGAGLELDGAAELLAELPPA